MKWCNRHSLLLPVVLSVLVLFGCATQGPPPNVKAVACEAKQIQWEVTPDVEVLNFACSLGKKGVDPALIYDLELKNITQIPIRYRVQIFLLDMDKAAGHLVPRKGKPPVVAAGKTEKVSIPFIKTDTMSNKVQVIIKSID